MDLSSLDPSLLSTIPSMAPPPGEVSNFVDPYSLANPVGRIVISVTLAPMILAVALRLYTRTFVTRPIGPDDYVCILAAAAVTSYCGIAIAGSAQGPHQWNIPITAINNDYLKHDLLVANLYSVGAMLTKISLLVLYQRLFQPLQKIRVILWVSGGIILAFYLANVIATCILCNPTNWPTDTAKFLEMQATSSCNKPLLTLSSTRGIFSILTDIFVLSIPIVLVWRLQLSLRQKIGVSCIFLLGLLATSCCIANSYFRFYLYSSLDYSWYGTIEFILGAVELNIGVICSCVPVSTVALKVITMYSWTSVTSFVKTRRSRSSGSSSSHESERKVSRESEHLSDNYSKMPRPPTTGFRSIVSEGHSQNHAALTQGSTFSEVRSVNEEYHEHLGAPQNAKYSTSAKEEPLSFAV